MTPEQDAGLSTRPSPRPPNERPIWPPLERPDTAQFARQARDLRAQAMHAAIAGAGPGLARLMRRTKRRLRASALSRLWRDGEGYRAAAAMVGGRR